jgi:hypothetical protein
MPSPKPPADKPRQWNATDQLPPTQDLIIELQGLFSICYLRDPQVPDPLQCQIGVFNQDPKHKLIITIEGGTCSGGLTSFEYTYAQVKQLANEKFRIGIVGANADVAFYQKQPRFNRATSSDLEDFRWLVDVETPDLYNLVTRKKQPHYGPKFLVKNGIFFTESVTCSTFKFVESQPGTDVQLLGRIAFSTAAKIKLHAGQQVEFKFKDQNGVAQTCTFEPVEPGQPNARIVVTNVCFETDGSLCRDGDFHLHFGSFDPPSDKRKYDLVLDQPCPPARQSGAAPRLPSGRLKTETDAAPCHAMGYGQTTGGTP